MCSRLFSLLLLEFIMLKRLPEKWLAKKVPIIIPTTIATEMSSGI